MPVLQAIRKQFIKTQPFADIRLPSAIGATAESANLLVTLRDGGAQVVVVENPDCPGDADVIAALAGLGIASVDLDAAIAAAGPSDLLLDSGGWLVRSWIARRAADQPQALGATEDSTNGAQRLRALDRQQRLTFPVVDLSESWTRAVFDRRHGVAQGTLDAIVRATGMLFAGVTIVVAGYGRCGRGLASRARGMGAQVIVTEVNPMHAVEALMDGFRVLNMSEAAALGDVICAVTGSRGVLARDQFEKLKNGALLVNAGHSDVEIDLDTLGRMALHRRPVGESVEEFAMRDGRRLRVLGSARPLGRMPSAPVADLNRGAQALALEYIIRNKGSLGPHVHGVPEGIDRGVARYKLEAMGIQIDRLSVTQEQYLASWSEGLQ